MFYDIEKHDNIIIVNGKPILAEDFYQQAEAVYSDENVIKIIRTFL